MNKRIRYLTTSAMIAAMYVALSAVSQLLGLCSGNIQCRISEALCVLPVFTNAAVPGVAIGCLITNILFGLGPVDVALGTLATVIGAVVCYLLRKLPYIASVPTIISNALIIPVVLIYYQISEGYLISAGWVALGEIIACGVLGTILVIWLKKSPKVTEKLFGQK